MNEFLTYTIIPIIGIIVYYSIKKSYESYLKEKGKNIAQKEDIQELTRLVEEVKKEFTKETDLIRASLNLNTQLKSSFVNEEKNSLLLWIEKYYIWANLLGDTNIGNYNEDKNEELDRFLIDLNKTYSDLTGAEARLMVFINDDTFIKLITDTKLTTLKELGGHLNIYITEIKYINSRIELYKNLPDYSSEDFKKMFEEKTAVRAKMQEEIIKGLKNLVPIQRKVVNHCRDYIITLLTTKL